MCSLPLSHQGSPLEFFAMNEISEQVSKGAGVQFQEGNGGRKIQQREKRSGPDPEDDKRQSEMTQTRVWETQGWCYGQRPPAFKEP